MRTIDITTFSLKFYLGFLIISLLGNFIIDYNSLSLYTIVCFFFYVSTFSFGTIFGKSISKIKLRKIKVSPFKLTKWLMIVSIIVVTLGWLLLIRYYGDLSTIILHAFDVRSETIGDGIQLVPVYLTYPGSLVYSAFAITLAIYHYHKNKTILFRLLILGLLIVLGDLQNFGRIGILFMIFMVVGYLVLFIRRLRLRKIALPTLLMFVILMLPRWLRGGSSFEGIGDRYSKYTTFAVPELLAPLLSVYAYYFSGIYALNELLIKEVNEFAYGKRNFASILNLFNRFLSEGEVSHRLVIIGDMVYVPFDTNIFTIIGEIYMDFGIIGIIILPFIFGTIVSYLFKYHGIYADALKMILLAWLFYTPIYNAFSFGGFLIAFVFTAMLVLFTDSNIEINRERI